MSEKEQARREISDCFDDVPDSIDAYCPCCKEYQVFNFDYEQRYPSVTGQKVFDVYTCTECYETLTKNHTPYWRQILESRGEPGVI